jgi:hypothetical protein
MRAHDLRSGRTRRGARDKGCVCVSIARVIQFHQIEDLVVPGYLKNTQYKGVI